MRMQNSGTSSSGTSKGKENGQNRSNVPAKSRSTNSGKTRSSDGKHMAEHSDGVAPDDDTGNDGVVPDDAANELHEVEPEADTRKMTREQRGLRSKHLRRKSLACAPARISS
jgi:hypothetical protein